MADLGEDGSDGLSSRRSPGGVTTETSVAAAASWPVADSVTATSKMVEP